MGIVTIQEETTKNPITLIGKEAGICWGANTEDNEKNFRRGMDCLASNHGRTLEYPQVYMILDGYSARVIREFYTHIGGGPTRLQASTRYIDYKNFSEKEEYIIPPTVFCSLKEKQTSTKPNITKISTALGIYKDCMDNIAKTMKILEEDFEIPKEDLALLLPLGMKTKIVVRTNLRNLIDMSHQRMCSRANWEFRCLMADISRALSEYSNEWDNIVINYFKPKCKVLGYCPEGKKSCGMVQTTRTKEFHKMVEDSNKEE